MQLLHPIGSQSAVLPAGYCLVASMHAVISLDMGHVSHLHAHMEHNVTSRHEGSQWKPLHGSRTQLLHVCRTLGSHSTVLPAG